MEYAKVNCTIGSLVESGMLKAMDGMERDLYDRIKGLELPAPDADRLRALAQVVGVTGEFRKIIALFKVEPGVIPAGFCPELVHCGDGSVRVDLRRDIAYAENGKKRPTNVLYSANTANLDDIRAMGSLLANVTTNPQLIYEGFLNNPKVNAGGKYKDRYEVLAAMAGMLGPGVDVSVEVDDPFADEGALLEEIARCEEVLTPYRLVVKVPHTGPLNRGNVPDLLSGRLERGYDEPDVADAFLGHNFAYRLAQKGYRVNFTLMFDPHQTALALQARPYFINAFVELRYANSLEMRRLLGLLDSTGDERYAVELRDFMLRIYEWPLGKREAPAGEAVERARQLVAYRELDTGMGRDGLDSVRYSLRWLRSSNLPDTRLIICNTKSQQMYWNIDKMLTEPEFADMTGRVVVTCDTPYFAQFTGAAGIYHYQKSFLANAPK